jgi:uncharacterized membrane protein
MITINWQDAADQAYLAVMTKTLTFAITHITVAFAVGWALTGSALVGGTLALVEPLINTVAYFFHERIWQRLGSVPKRDRAHARRLHPKQAYARC